MGSFLGTLSITTPKKEAMEAPKQKAKNTIMICRISKVTVVLSA